MTPEQGIQLLWPAVRKADWPLMAEFVRNYPHLIAALDDFTEWKHEQAVRTQKT